MLVIFLHPSGETSLNFLSPSQCEGFLQWEEVQRGVRIRNVTLETDGIYQFAVAANSGRKSSGMIWATCTILHDKGISYIP